MQNLKDIEIHQTKGYGDMSLCNLASINLATYRKASDRERKDICRSILEGLDSAMAVGSCPVPEGEISNELYRYVGVGVMNAAAALAAEKIVIDTQEAAEWYDEVMDDISFNLYEASMLLSKEYGPCKMFESTKWAEGKTPVTESMRCFPKAWEVTEYGRTFISEGRLNRWLDLAKQIQKHGIRHAQVMAIAPTANSGKAINATESTEPVMGLIFKEEGMFNVVSLAPDIKENMAYYKPAFSCDQMALVNNAIVRQKYIDQAQSITIYLERADSLKVMTDLHLHGFLRGIKTFYYLKQQKQQDINECMACAV